MGGRRVLAFTRLDDVMPDVEHLLAGHVTVGRWSLDQICNHLALTIRLSVDGVPEKASWLTRRTVGVFGRWYLFRTGRMPEGVRVPAIYLPKPGGEARREADALREALARFQAYAGPFDEHPILGPLSPRQWARFHCIHCAHHLSFAVPVAGAGGASPFPGRAFA